MLGVKVTIVEMLDQLVPGEDRRAAAALSQAFRKAGVESRLKARVEGVDVSHSDHVGLALADGPAVAAALVKRGVLREESRRVERVAYADDFAVGELVAAQPRQLNLDQERAVGQVAAERAGADASFLQACSWRGRS